VTVEAVVGDDRADIAIELDLLLGREGGGYEEGQERQEGLTHGEGVSSIKWLNDRGEAGLGQI
jgi:hypothetical protein